MKYKDHALLENLKLWHAAGYNRGSCALGLESSYGTVAYMARHLGLPKFGRKSLPASWIAAVRNCDAGIAPNLLNGYRRCRKVVFDDPYVEISTLKLFFLGVLDDSTLATWKARLVAERRARWLIRAQGSKLRLAASKRLQSPSDANSLSEKHTSISDRAS